MIVKWMQLLLLLILILSISTLFMNMFLREETRDVVINVHSKINVMEDNKIVLSPPHKEIAIPKPLSLGVLFLYESKYHDEFIINLETMPHPCYENPYFHANADLIFYYQQDDLTEQNKHALMVAMSKSKSCFEDILFYEYKNITLKTTISSIVYNTNIPFFQLLNYTQQIWIQKYTYIFYKTIDTTMIRQYWLSHLLQKCIISSPFWVRGGTSVYLSNQPIDVQYITRNALFAAPSNDLFDEFVRMVNAAIEEHPSVVFDQAIGDFLREKTQSKIKVNWRYQTEFDNKGAINFNVQTKYVFDYFVLNLALKYSFHDIITLLPSNDIYFVYQQKKNNNDNNNNDNNNNDKISIV